VGRRREGEEERVGRKKEGEEERVVRMVRMVRESVYERSDVNRCV
jgi:hypothetical protein